MQGHQRLVCTRQASFADRSIHFRGTNYRLIVATDSGRGAARAEDAPGTPIQSHISPSILVHEDKVPSNPELCGCWPTLHQGLVHRGGHQPWQALYRRTSKPQSQNLKISTQNLSRKPQTPSHTPSPHPLYPTKAK